MDLLRFSADLYRALGRPDENLCVSPYSIATAMAMVHAGAAGTTRDSIRRGLRLDEGFESLFAATARELASRADLSSYQGMGVDPENFACRLSIANAVWRQTGYRLREPFVVSLKENFGADAFEIDFRKADDACAQVNGWVSRQTRERIRQMLTPASLKSELRAILANAVYFKAGWRDDFGEAATRPEPFHAADGSRIQVPMMHSTRSMPYAKLGPIQAAELHYVNRSLSMILIVPDAGKLQEVERALDLASIVSSLHYQKVALGLPRFKFETDAPLRVPLSELGMAPAFSPTADFSAASDEPGFHIDEVLHRTFLAVDEKGTEAAAVTMPMAAGCAAPKPEPIIPLTIDRPFLVLILDRPTMAPLFLARVAKPPAVGR